MREGSRNTHIHSTEQNIRKIGNVKRGSRVVSALASGARGPGFDTRRRRGKFVGPNLLPFVSFAGMT